MKKLTFTCLALVFLLLGVSGASGAEIVLEEYGFNVNGTVYTPSDPLPAFVNAAGFDFSTGLGTVTLTITGAGSHSVLSFFDHEIDQAINTFFNEIGAVSGLAAPGQSWEIDEPGYSFGDIYANFQAGILDNSIGTLDPEDVSMALGWNFALANPGDLATIQFLISTVAPAGGFYLSQTDPESVATIYFSSDLTIVPIPVPGTLFLLGSGVVGLLGLRRRKIFIAEKLRTSVLAALVTLLAVIGVSVNHSEAQPAPASDLLIISVDVSGMTTDCESLQVNGTAAATVKNSGATGTGVGFTVLFFEDADGNGKFDSVVDSTLGSAVHGALNAGSTATVSATVSGIVAFKGNLVYAFVDSGNQVAELNESNNYSNSGFACQFAPAPGAFDPVLKWSWTSSAVLPTYLNVMTTPGVIDLTNDGIPDVVFGATSSTGGGYVEVGVLRALNGLNGSELFTVTDATKRISTTSSVAVGDIDLDGRPEILACASTGARLYAFEHDGAFKWESPSNLEAINWGSPAIADLDGDGTPEIIIGRQVLNSNGTVRWTGTGGRGTQSNIGPLSLVADINMDGSPEVVAGNTAYTAAGAILWRNVNLPDGYNAVADFDDGDGYPEIVLVSGGSVWLLEHTGAVKWGPFAIPGGGGGGAPTVADYDNDGQVEIGVAGASRYVVIETNGTLKWAAVTQDGSSNVTGSSVFDFEGDGSAEVVYADELYLRIYRGTDGAVLFQTPKSSCTWYEYPLVADVDGDGKAEIVAVANNNCGYGAQRGVYVYGSASDSWVPTRKIWNQHTYHITNINDNGTIPAVEANNWATFNNYRQNVQTQGSALAAPDLTASFIQIDTADCPESVSIIARIGNGGSNVAVAPIFVAFYDGDPGTGGMLLGVASTTRNLNPGQYEDVAFMPSFPLFGTINICVVADDDGTGSGAVNECNESNNQCCARSLASCSCVDDLKARPKLKKIQLTWTYTGAHHYNIYRGTITGGPYLKIASTTSTYSTYLDLAVVMNTTYYYVVREATAGDNEFCQSNEASAKALPR